MLLLFTLTRSRTLGRVGNSYGLLDRFFSLRYLGSDIFPKRFFRGAFDEWH